MKKGLLPIALANKYKIEHLRELCPKEIIRKSSLTFIIAGAIGLNYTQVSFLVLSCNTVTMDYFLSPQVWENILRSVNK